MSSPRPSEQHRKRKQMRLSVPIRWNLRAEIKSGHQGGGHDQEDREHQVGQHLPEHDLAPPQGGDHELVKRARFPLPRHRAGHEGHGEQLQDEPDDPRDGIVDEPLVRIVEDIGLHRPGIHDGVQLVADGRRQFLRQVEDLDRQAVHDDLFPAVAMLELAQRFLDRAVELLAGGGVAAIHIELQRERLFRPPGSGPSRRG